jgi:hypothetical protein
MTKLLTLITIFSAISFGGVTETFAGPPDPASAHGIRSTRVRAADSRTAALLVQGLERSETIRTLVNELQRRDVIVYLEMQPTLKKRLAGTMTWLSAGGAYRYVRVSINPELTNELAIATLGHELQHALEVASAPEIVNEKTMAMYYQTHGDGSRAHAGGWDTEAARTAGYVVRRELAAPRTARVADSIQQFNPQDWFNVYRRAQGMLPP